MGGGGTHGADGFTAGEHGRAGFWCGIFKFDANRSRACGAAMLHPRHHLLADIAALVEIDAVKPVHVGFVRKGIAIAEVEAAAGNAQRDAVGLVGRTVDHLRSDQVSGFLRQLFGEEYAKAKPGIARIGEGEIRFHRSLAVPCREHAETTGEIFDRDIGAQPIETEVIRKALREHFRAIDQKAAAVTGRRLGDQEVGGDLALWRQQRAEASQSRPQQRRVCGDEAVEKVAGVSAGDFDHATIRQKRSFHTSAHFPKFVLHLSTHLSRTSESHGH
jgi:hypothetical protein